MVSKIFYRKSKSVQGRIFPPGIFISKTSNKNVIKLLYIILFTDILFSDILFLAVKKEIVKAAVHSF
jgi:hypothetical protein